MTPRDNFIRGRTPAPGTAAAVTLADAALFLVAMHPLSRFMGTTAHWWFDLDGEGNVPALFSTALLAAVALTALRIHRVKQGRSGESVFGRLFWLWFACFYLFLAIDEGVGIHELVDRFVGLKWVYVYLPFMGVAFAGILYYFGRLRREDRNLRQWIVGGLVVFAYGGLVCEFIGHRLCPLPFAWQVTEILAEEGLEILGTIMVLKGCLGELGRIRRGRRDLF